MLPASAGSAFVAQLEERRLLKAGSRLFDSGRSHSDSGHSGMYLVNYPWTVTDLRIALKMAVDYTGKSLV